IRHDASTIATSSSRSGQATILIERVHTLAAALMILPTAGQATAQKKGLHELVPAGRAKTAKGSEVNGRTSVGAGGTGRGQTQTLGAFATCELLEFLDRRRRSHLFVARF